MEEEKRKPWQPGPSPSASSSYVVMVTRLSCGLLRGWGRKTMRSSSFVTLEVGKRAGKEVRGSLEFEGNEGVPMEGNGEGAG